MFQGMATSLERSSMPTVGTTTIIIVTCRCDGRFKLYYGKYCARANMENWVKDQHLCLFADRTSNELSALVRKLVPN